MFKYWCAFVVFAMVAIGGCVCLPKNQEVKNDQITYFYVEYARPNMYLGRGYDVCLMQLTQQEALKKAEIFDKISNKLAYLSDNYRKVDKTNQKALISWQKSFQRQKPAISNLFKKLSAITGPREQIVLTPNDLPAVYTGMALKREFVKDTEIDNSGMVKVSRQNFYRWTVIDH
jgi:hypothetical protein